jgi:LacI family transcriptional regulator
MPRLEPLELQLVFHDHDPVNSELAVQMQSGAQQEAAASGVPLRIGWTHRTSEVVALARQSGGVILFGPHEQDTLDALVSIGRPVVKVGWLRPLEPIDQVMGSDHEAGAAVGNFLADLGHRHIAYVRGRDGLRGRLERLLGLREAAELERGARVHELTFAETGGFVAGFDALRATGVEVTAFFCAHDGLAVTVVSELSRLGYRVPEDFSVVGFGDFSAAMQITPHLTTVRLPGRDMGIAAVRMLLERMRAPERTLASAQRLYVVPRIIERGSSGPARPRRRAG